VQSVTLRVLRRSLRGLGGHRCACGYFHNVRDDTSGPYQLSE
jgi:hypothetical protein